MRDTAKGRKQGRKPDQPEKEVWLASAEVARLISESSKNVRNCCNAGLYPGARKAQMNGGEGWQIPLNCLPQSAQIAWHDSQHKKRTEKASLGRISGRDKGSASETDAHQAPSAFNVQAYKDGANVSASGTGLFRAGVARNLVLRRPQGRCVREKHSGGSVPADSGRMDGPTQPPIAGVDGTRWRIPAFFRAALGGPMT